MRSNLAARSLIVASLFVFATISAHSQTIRHLDSMDSVDKHGAYFVQLLNLAMAKSKAKYGPYDFKALPVQMRQERQFKSLQANMLDVIWSVTSIEREASALPVRVPLLKGLIGNRVLVIDANNASLFSSVTTLAQLAQHTGVQGHDWPDATIMEHAGLKVERIVWHSTMYKLISSGIVDYFPRSVLEVEEELQRAKNSNLMIEPNLLLVYPSAIYFFVNADNTLLAERLEFGLLEAIKDGSFDKVFYSFKGHMEALKQINIKQRQTFYLANPILPKETPIDIDEFWLTSVKPL